MFGRTDWKRYTTKNTPEFLEVILIRLFYWVGTPFHKQYPYSIYRWCRNTSKHLQAPQQQQTIRKLGAGVDPRYTSKNPHPMIFRWNSVKHVNYWWSTPRICEDSHVKQFHLLKFWSTPSMKPFFLNQGTPGASVSWFFFSRLLQLQHLNKMDIVSNLESMNFLGEACSIFG